MQGIGFSHYLAVGDYNGDLTIFLKKANQFTLHQTIPAGNGIWEVTMTDDVGYSSCPAVYVLNSSTQQFDLMQEFPQQTDVLLFRCLLIINSLLLATQMGKLLFIGLLRGSMRKII